MQIIGAGDYLASAVQANGAVSTAQDCRRTQDYGYLFYVASGQSALWQLQASHNTTAWLPVQTFTATATETGTAQLMGFYPYLRVNVLSAFSGGGATGTLWVFYQPGF